MRNILVRGKLRVSLGSEQRRYGGLPDSANLRPEARRTPCIALCRKSVRKVRNPIGSKKSRQIVIESDTRTPLYRAAAWRCSYSKVWYIQPSKIRNENPRTHRDPAHPVFEGDNKNMGRASRVIW